MGHVFERLLYQIAWYDDVCVCSYWTSWWSYTRLCCPSETYLSWRPCTSEFYQHNSTLSFSLNGGVLVHLDFFHEQKISQSGIFLQINHGLFLWSKKYQPDTLLQSVHAPLFMRYRIMVTRWGISEYLFFLADWLSLTWRRHFVSWSCSTAQRG